MAFMAYSGLDVHLDKDGGQGTVGGWLVHAPTGLRFGFSNCHVIAALGQAPVGAPVYQHGRVIGTLHSYILLDEAYYNAADIALFQVEQRVVPVWGHPAPRGHRAAAVGQRVYKVGAGTGRTTGLVVGIGAEQRMKLGSGHYWFEGIVRIRGDNGPFSAHGDSGSLVLSEDHHAVAILFGKDPRTGLANALTLGPTAPLFAGLQFLS